MGSVDRENQKQNGAVQSQADSAEKLPTGGATACHATESKGTGFEPKIVAFVCNWCTYTGADLAGTSRMKMSPNVRVLRLNCSSRVSPLFIIKALEKGADGVIVSGCHPGDCHYSTGNYYTRRRLAILHDLLEFLGVDNRRITFSWVSASEGWKWQQVVNETTERVRQLGPQHSKTGRTAVEGGQ